MKKPLLSCKSLNPVNPDSDNDPRTPIEVREICGIRANLRFGQTIDKIFTPL